MRTIVEIVDKALTELKGCDTVWRVSQQTFTRLSEHPDFIPMRSHEPSFKGMFGTNGAGVYISDVMIAGFGELIDVGGYDAVTINTLEVDE